MQKINIDIAPISVNKCWQGRRFATKEYKEWTEQCLWELKKYKRQVNKPYRISLIFYQNARQDIDAAIKMTLDVLVKAGLIEDDRYIMELNVRKIVSKENKRIEIEIEEIK